jgi:hypothetical protein
MLDFPPLPALSPVCVLCKTILETKIRKKLEMQCCFFQEIGVILGHQYPKLQLFDDERHYMRDENPHASGNFISHRL